MKCFLSLFSLLSATASAGRYGSWDDVKNSVVGETNGKTNTNNKEGSDQFPTAGVYYEGHRLSLYLQPEWFMSDLEAAIRHELVSRRAGVAQDFKFKVQPGGIDLNTYDPNKALSRFAHPSMRIDVTGVAGKGRRDGHWGTRWGAHRARATQSRQKRKVALAVEFDGSPLPIMASSHWSVHHLEVSIRDELRKRMRREPPSIVMHMYPGDLNLNIVDKSAELSEFGALSDNQNKNAVRIVATRGGPVVTTATTTRAAAGTANPSGRTNAGTAAAGAANPSGSTDAGTATGTNAAAAGVVSSNPVGSTGAANPAATAAAAAASPPVATNAATVAPATANPTAATNGNFGTR